MSKTIPLPRKRGPATGGVKRINLALQGGGSHGAFSWGVLDRLLEDPTESRSTASPAPRPARSMRSCSPTASRRATANRRATH